LKIEPKAVEGPRLYKGAGFAVPSVTEVLSVAERRPFDAWRKRVGRKEADRVVAEAKILGTKVHALAQTLANDRNAPVEPEMRPYADAIKEFHALHVRRVLETEMSLTSRGLGFGGTLDLYCEMNDGSRAIVDYKTTSRLTREHGLQLAGYALLLKEHGHVVNRRVCMRLRKDEPGRWYARVYRDHREDVEAFRACVTLWSWMHRKKLLKATEVAA
jgi:predicted RecB family nuclease